MTAVSNTHSSAEYFRPLSLEAGLELLSKHSLKIVAGATDIYPQRVAARVWGDGQNKDSSAESQSWLDITALEELCTIDESDDGWRIGAGVTWSRLLETRLPASFDALKAAAREVGGLQIQNRGTLGGNLCNASPAADGVPPLLCLDAQVELASATGRRCLPLSEFILGNRKTARRGDELMSAIFIPRRASPDSSLIESSEFFKLGARKYLVISIVMAASVMRLSKQGEIMSCQLAVGACSAVAQRLPLLETALVGVNLASLAAKPNALNDLVGRAFFETLTPIDDVRANAAYRLEAARQCVLTLLERHIEPPPDAADPAEQGGP